jgi:hypothetical protein
MGGSLIAIAYGQFPLLLCGKTSSKQHRAEGRGERLAYFHIYTCLCGRQTRLASVSGPPSTLIVSSQLALLLRLPPSTILVAPSELVILYLVQLEYMAKGGCSSQPRVPAVFTLSFHSPSLIKPSSWGWSKKKKKEHRKLLNILY